MLEIAAWGVIFFGEAMIGDVNLLREPFVEAEIVPGAGEMVVEGTGASAEGALGRTV